jgi:hypothetical protein
MVESAVDSDGQGDQLDGDDEAYCWEHYERWLLAIFLIFLFFFFFGIIKAYSVRECSFGYSWQEECIGHVWCTMLTKYIMQGER